MYRLILDVCGCLFILLVCYWVFSWRLMAYYERLNEQHHAELRKEQDDE